MLKALDAHHDSIVLDEKRHLLFGYVEIESETQWDAVAQTDVCQRWWKHMSDVMPASPESAALKPVFYLD